MWRDLRRLKWAAEGCMSCLLGVEPPWKGREGSGQELCRQTDRRTEEHPPRKGMWARSSAPGERTRRRHLLAGKQAFTRRQSCWCPALELAACRTVRDNDRPLSLDRLDRAAGLPPTAQPPAEPSPQARPPCWARVKPDRGDRGVFEISLPSASFCYELTCSKT